MSMNGVRRMSPKRQHSIGAAFCVFLVMMVGCGLAHVEETPEAHPSSPDGLIESIEP